ncbi:class I SAM-dependent methyltransferase [Streptomyces sp. AD681]|uniref:class I SAM-dependent methyltransferase n=1 Tax=Streptomyces sp. AD681 TaxID=3019069 RepID=UPI0022F16FD5|nr:class I SAM-dependent methyltransferase [Streptomyces sp. AD681]MDA5147381.1 class I SAM-dependent methyltransferase [Streptomyces sp. AD681]
MNASRKETLRQLWGESAVEYRDHVKKFATHRRISLLLLSALTRSPKSILDFGCGPGNSTRLLRKFFPEAHIVGIDSSPEMIRLAQSETDPGLNIAYRCSDLTSSEESGGSFDVIFCSNSLFHVDDKSQLLSRFQKILKPGGCVVFSMYEFLFQPQGDIGWPYAEAIADSLIPHVVEKLQGYGYPVVSRKEDREIFREIELKDLFLARGLIVRCAGIIRINRTWEERRSFFRIPSVAQEVFPNVPTEDVRRALDSVSLDSVYPDQERNVYGFVAEMA